MCCFSLGFLKHTLSFFGYIQILVGVAGLTCGVIYIIDQGGHIDTDSFNPVSATTILLLVAGLIYLFLGIIGVVGAKKQSKCCMCIYQFSVLPVFLLSLACVILSVVANVFANSMEDGYKDIKECKWYQPECKGCGDQEDYLDWITKINKGAFYVSTEILGHQDNCKILAANEEQKLQYLALDFTQVTTDKSDKNAVTNAKDCNLSGDAQQAADFLSYFEETFKCSGMCADTPFFAFYDTTKGFKENRKSCYSKVIDLFSSTTMAVIVWAIFIFFSLNLLFQCCLCCHPKREKEGRSVYQRMDYHQ